EFRKNILASSELVASFERMISQIKEQTRAMESVSVDLQTEIKVQTEELQKQISVCLQKQADLIAAQSKGFDVTSKAVTDAVGKQLDEIVNQSRENVKNFNSISRALNESFSAATRELKTMLLQQTDAMSNRADAVLAEQVENLTRANQEQIRMATDAMAATNREFAAKCEEVTKSFVTTQEALNARYEQVLQKLEAANVSETVRLSKSILKSVNIKFGIMLTGVVASIVIAVLSYIK
ncbi:MAG: hypothetical protein Q4A54_08040, partial [Parabacteroides sp.]|nr:hypothetical protein [Parabacteroides sp.]